MKPSLHLQPSQPSYAPGEIVCLTVLLGNPGDVVLPLPLPAASWSSHLSARIIRPDGKVIDLPAEPPNPLSTGTGARLEVWPGGEAEASLPFYDISLAWVPGEYVATVAIQTTEGTWITPESRFRLEPSGSMEVVPALAPDSTEDQPFSVWTLHHGLGTAALQRRTAAWVSPESTTEVSVEAPKRWLDLPGDSTDIIPFVAPDGAEWIAWRRPDTIGIARSRGTRLQTEIPSPTPHCRLVGLVPGLDNGVRLLVQDLAGTILWCHSASTPLPAQKTVSFPAERSLPAPIPAGQTQLPWTPAVLGAAALATGPVAILGARQAEDGVDLAYTLLAADGEPIWECGRIPDAVLIPDLAPALAIAADNTVEVALLVTADGPDAKQLALVRFAFDMTGRPIQRNGVGWFDLGPVEATPEAAAVTLRPSPDHSRIHADWCVLLPGNRAVAGTDNRERRATVLEYPVARPIRLICISGRIAVVTTTGAGRIEIIEL